MSVGRKIRGLVGISLSAVCASQVSFAKNYVLHDETNGDSVTYIIDEERRTMYIKGKGLIRGIAQKDKHMSRPLYYLSEIGDWVSNVSIGYTHDSGRAVQKSMPAYSLIDKVIIDPNSGLYAIGEKAFSGFTSLGEIVIPGCIKYIRYKAFNKCRRLKSVKIGYGLQMIDEQAFCGCHSLKKLVLPLSIKGWGKSMVDNTRGVLSREPDPGYFEISLEEIEFIDKNNKSFKVSGLGFDQDAEGFNPGSVKKSVKETFNLGTGLNGNISKTLNIIKGYVFGKDVYDNRVVLPLPVVGRDEYGNKIGTSSEEIAAGLGGIVNGKLCCNFESTNLELLKKDPSTLGQDDRTLFDISKRNISKLVSWITSMNANKVNRSRIRIKEKKIFKNLIRYQ